MIEWAKDGRRILVENQDMDPNQRTAMLKQIEAVELAGEAFNKAEAFRRAALPGREPEAVSKAFAKSYPDHADAGFTYDVQVTLALDAPEEVRRLNHNYIGTEHILLGLTHEESPASPILRSLGVNTEKIRSAVESIIGRGERKVLGDIGLTPRARRVLDLSIEEARRLNNSGVSGEHLLLGLVKEGEGIAAGVLESVGVSLDKVRGAVRSAQLQRSNG